VSASPRGVKKSGAFVGGRDEGEGLGIEKSDAVGEGRVGEEEAFDGGLGAFFALEEVAEGLEESGSVIDIEMPFFPLVTAAFGRWGWGVHDAEIFGEDGAGDLQFIDRF